jgi:hypothetical protein
MAVDKNGILYVGGSRTIRTFLTDGTPLEVFAANLLGDVVDIEFVEVIPEPDGLIIAAIASALAAMCLGRSIIEATRSNPAQSAASLIFYLRSRRLVQ